MRVGIITFHRVNNYGAVLQAYALQKTIQGMDCRCDIIDYSRKNLRDIYLWQKNKIGSLLKGKPDKQGYSNLEFLDMVFTTIFFNKKEVSAKFTAFRSKYSKSPSVNSDNIMSLNSNYDLFITGSDQVWNCGRVYLDKNYFLDFVDRSEKKGSYAASFGIKEIPGKYVNEYQRMLSDFTYLSVREASGANLIKQLISREAKVVLDPTLLLNKEQWSALTTGSKKENVIVVYMLEYSENLIRFARSLSKEVKCPLRLLNKPYHHKITEECRTDVGPIEWLTELQNAKYVVTNSFHGVAFSINFNKNFFVEIAGDRIRGAMASRIENILEIFGLKDRLIPHNFSGILTSSETTIATNNENGERKIPSNADSSGSASDKSVVSNGSMCEEKASSHPFYEMPIKHDGKSNIKSYFSFTAQIPYEGINDKLRELREDSLEYLKNMLHEK